MPVVRARRAISGLFYTAVTARKILAPPVRYGAASWLPVCSGDRPPGRKTDTTVAPVAGKVYTTVQNWYSTQCCRQGSRTVPHLPCFVERAGSAFPFQITQLATLFAAWRGLRMRLRHGSDDLRNGMPSMGTCGRGTVSSFTVNGCTACCLPPSPSLCVQI